MNDNSLIKDIGRSYIVSSFLPAVLFVSIGIMIFRGFTPEIVVLRVGEKNIFYASQLFLFFAFTSWLAFGLYSTANATVRFFEGYYLPSQISKPMAEQLGRKFEKRKESIQAVLDIVESKDPEEFSIEELLDFSEQQEKAKYEYLRLETVAPIDSSLLLPTRLGNILRASELYPAEKYAVPGVMLWPRLLQLLPKDLKDQLEEKNNQMVFTLNSSMLCYLIGLVSALVGTARLLNEVWNKLLGVPSSHPANFFDRGFTNISPFEYILIGLLFFGLGYIAYRLCIPTAENFGLLIRTSYDLYRFELLRQLNHPIPKSIQEEKNLWEKIGEYMIAGDRLAFQPAEIDYSIRKDLLNYDLPARKRSPRRKKRK